MPPDLPSPINPALDLRMSPVDLLEFHTYRATPMSPHKAGLREAGAILRQREVDAKVTFVAIPTAAVAALHDAWHSDDPRELAAAVRDAFRGQDGELTALPDPRR